MPRRINVTDFDNDNLTLIYQDPYVLSCVDRRGITKLNVDATEMNSPGIYILVGEGQVYVGQSGSSLSQRVLSHSKDSKKDWFDNVVMFAKRGGVLDGAQLNYIERTLISALKDAGYVLDNKVGGNSSNHLEGFRLSEATNALNEFAHMLDKFRGSLGFDTPLVLEALEGKNIQDNPKTVPFRKVSQTKVKTPQGEVVAGEGAKSHNDFHSPYSTKNSVMPVNSSTVVHPEQIIALMEEFVSTAKDRNRNGTHDTTMEEIYRFVQRNMPVLVNREFFLDVMQQYLYTEDTMVLGEPTGTFWSALEPDDETVSVYNSIVDNYVKSNGIISIAVNYVAGSVEKTDLLTSTSIEGISELLANYGEVKFPKFYVVDTDVRVREQIPSIATLLNYMNYVGDIQLEEERVNVIKKVERGFKNFFKS